MIIVKTPLRLSLGGGGTDLPSYYQKFGGFFVAGALQLFSSTQISLPFDGKWTIRAPEVETTFNLSQVSHPLIRHTLQALEVTQPLNICINGDVPAGSGLGGSGALIVSLLHGLFSHLSRPYSAKLLAHHGFEIETKRLAAPIGPQDHLCAAHGGINGYTIATNGTVTLNPVFASSKQSDAFANCLLLCFSGQTRRSHNILQSQQAQTLSGNSGLINNLHTVKQLGIESFNCLKSSRFDDYALLLKEHWQIKQQRHQDNCSETLQRIHDHALRHGALAGKLVGGGGGGFFLFYSHEIPRLDDALKAKGLHTFRIRFCPHGSRLITE